MATEEDYTQCSLAPAECVRDGSSIAALRQGLAAGAGWIESKAVASKVLGSRFYPVIMAIGLVAIITLALMVASTKLPFGHVSSAYLIPVLFCATRWGVASALIAGGLGVVAADFFFIPPIYAFTIDNWKTSSIWCRSGAWPSSRANLRRGCGTKPNSRASGKARSTWDILRRLDIDNAGGGVQMRVLDVRGFGLPAARRPGHVGDGHIGENPP